MTRKQKERLGDIAFITVPVIAILLIALTEVWL